MNVKDFLAQLESMGDDARRKHNSRVGPDGVAPPKKQFGVPLGDVRAIARKIKPPPPLRELALQLWSTAILEAQLVAALLLKPKDLSSNDIDTMLPTTVSGQAAEWMNSYVVAQHPDKEALREKWMKSKEPWTARAGWHLTAARVNKGDMAGLDLDGLLDRIEKEMPKAKPEVQWTMNNTLMAIGVAQAAHRARAVKIGEKIGLYKDWPQSKGCIIPYAPTAIEALVKKK